MPEGEVPDYHQRLRDMGLSAQVDQFEDVGGNVRDVQLDLLSGKEPLDPTSLRRGYGWGPNAEKFHNIFVLGPKNISDLDKQALRAQLVARPDSDGLLGDDESEKLLKLLAALNGSWADVADGASITDKLQTVAETADPKFEQFLDKLISEGWAFDDDGFSFFGTLYENSDDLYYAWMYGLIPDESPEYVYVPEIDLSEKTITLPPDWTAEEAVQYLMEQSLGEDTDLTREYIESLIERDLEGNLDEIEDVLRDSREEILADAAEGIETAIVTIAGTAPGGSLMVAVNYAMMGEWEKAGWEAAFGSLDLIPLGGQAISFIPMRVVKRITQLEKSGLGDEARRLAGRYPKYTPDQLKNLSPAQRSEVARAFDDVDGALREADELEQAAAAAGKESDESDRLAREAYERDQAAYQRQQAAAAEAEEYEEMAAQEAYERQQRAAAEQAEEYAMVGSGADEANQMSGGGSSGSGSSGASSSAGGSSGGSSGSGSSGSGGSTGGGSSGSGTTGGGSFDGGGSTGSGAGAGSPGGGSGGRRFLDQNDPNVIALKDEGWTDDEILEYINSGDDRANEFRLSNDFDPDKIDEIEGTINLLEEIAITAPNNAAVRQLDTLTDTQRAAFQQNTVIGKQKNILPENLRLGDEPLPTNLDMEWPENMALLQKVMDEGRPIRDLDPFDNSGFLLLEHAQLDDAGWTLTQIGDDFFWLPPNF